ncbi:MAG: hypothetical protein ABIU87_00435 [Ornithinibacter sp.]
MSGERQQRPEPCPVPVPAATHRGSGPHRSRRDLSHHHPRVLLGPGGSWEWDCACGSHAGRRIRRSWRLALIEALAHSTQLAA